MRRVLLGGAALALVLAAVVGFWLLRSLDARVARTLERVGSELLGSEVTVGAVDVELRAGRATVRDLEVANPRGEGTGFSDRPALSAGEISVTLDAASLTASPIVLTEVSVRELFVNLEVTEGGLNALTLSRNVDRARPEQADAAAEEPEPRRFRIGALRFEEGTLRVDASAVGREVREIPLEGFTLRALGGPEGGTPGVLGRQVLGSFLNAVLSKAANDRVSELLEEQLDQVKERLGEVLKSIFGAKKKKEE
jgi:hypothetical protein